MPGSGPPRLAVLTAREASASVTRLMVLAVTSAGVTCACMVLRGGLKRLEDGARVRSIAIARAAQ